MPRKREPLPTEVDWDKQLKKLAKKLGVSVDFLVKHPKFLEESPTFLLSQILEELKEIRKLLKKDKGGKP